MHTGFNKRVKLAEAPITCAQLQAERRVEGSATVSPRNSCTCLGQGYNNVLQAPSQTKFGSAPVGR